MENVREKIVKAWLKETPVWVTIKNHDSELCKVVTMNPADNTFVLIYDDGSTRKKWSFSDVLEVGFPDLSSVEVVDLSAQRWEYSDNDDQDTPRILRIYPFDERSMLVFGGGATADQMICMAAASQMLEALEKARSYFLTKSRIIEHTLLEEMNVAINKARGE